MPNTKNLLFATIEKHVKTYIGHPYLQACHVPQSISRFHFDVAYAILTAAQVGDITTSRILEAILLLQGGLSIHDEIDTNSGVRRQLTVLAGDYHSSQYYYILARLDDCTLLSRFSDAIVRINEAKMALYASEGQVDAVNYLILQEAIQGSLLMSLAEHLFGSNEVWLGEVQSLVKAYVVEMGIVASTPPRSFTFRQAYDWLKDSFNQARTIPAGTIAGPIYNFLVEYLLPIQNKLEMLNFAEGNR